MTTLAQSLAGFAADTTAFTLPPEVRKSTKQRVLDTLGVSLAAAGAGLGDGVANVVARWGGASEATLLGRDERLPATCAALHNGTLAHSLDFDDTHLPSIIHPSASVVPATLAVAEACRRSGAEAVAAIAVGIEIAVRTGMAGYVQGRGNVFLERGWHATSICGTLGVAAAAAKLMGLDADGIAHAIGVSGSMASGIIEANRAGGTVKRVHCGWAAHAGIVAAELVAAGYTGPPTVLEGRFGLYEAFLGGDANPGCVVEGLGTHWELPGIVFKPYPTNHFTHAGIDAALALRRKHHIDPTEVAKVRYGTGTAPLRTIGEPYQQKIRPLSGYHAQFSGPFTFAAALIGGGGLGVYFEDFTDEQARDPQVLALAEKVEMFVDDACDRAFPRQFAAAISVHTRDGAVHEARVMQSRGGPGRPLSAEELQQKFMLNCERGHLTPGDADRLAAAVLELDVAPSVRDTLVLASVRRRPAR